jgi:hypothetical protein
MFTLNNAVLHRMCFVLFLLFFFCTLPRFRVCVCYIYLYVCVCRDPLTAISGYFVNVWRKRVISRPTRACLLFFSFFSSPPNV